MSEITLTATQRMTLLSLQDTLSLYNTTQEALNTGKKVNSAADNSFAYYQSESLYNRASTLSTVKDNIGQNIEALNAAQAGTSQVETLLQSMQAVVEGAHSDSPSEQASATQQFVTLANQLAQLVLDTSYQGLNLIASTNAQLITNFSNRSNSVFTVDGYNLVDSLGGNARSLFTQTDAVFTSQGAIIFSEIVGNSAGPGGSPTTSIQGFSQLNLSASPGSPIPASQAQVIFNDTASRISNAITQIQGITTSIGTNVGILTSRSNFTNTYMTDLTEGGDALTLADLNTEAANSQALELRQQLGIQSLSVTGGLNQSVLQLLK